MRKKLCLFLAIVLLISLSGCGSNKPEETTAPATIPTTATPETTIPETTIPETTVPETTVAETYPASGVYGGNIVLGNITFEIPNDFTVTVVDDASFVLASADDDCAIALAAIDISMLDEENAKKYLPMVNESFVDFGTDIVVPSDEDIIGELAGFPIVMRACGTSDGVNFVFHADTTFTDSWYAYTIIYKCDFGSEKLSDYHSLLISMMLNAEHNGREQRFDFVQ